jgi:hypothetical protein
LKMVESQNLLFYLRHCDDGEQIISIASSSVRQNNNKSESRRIWKARDGRNEKRSDLSDLRYTALYLCIPKSAPNVCHRDIWYSTQVQR